MEVSAGQVVLEVVGGIDLEQVEYVALTPGRLAFRPVLEVNPGVSPLLIDALEYERSVTTTTGSASPDLTPVLPEGIEICDGEVPLPEQPGCVDGATGITLSDDPARTRGWLTRTPARRSAWARPGCWRPTYPMRNPPSISKRIAAGWESGWCPSTSAPTVLPSSSR